MALGRSKAVALKCKNLTWTWMVDVYDDTEIMEATVKQMEKLERKKCRLVLENKIGNLKRDLTICQREQKVGT